ncbi:glutaredoxin family protein [Ignatzschineria rhizosphaerae]|uniref:Glutaredoxin family protein n=1 Tax=Ignatzschineria rhizosphaerae TaxID=2923279 RepID=A0ABY3WXB9_9GAMM|nr:glutaredoxin family protein [Ignatzschineria rhizosphaerae]UNM95249.1 glutaredoxin family protein [Ignatzschineria rhizosphaerae]
MTLQTFDIILYSTLDCQLCEAVEERLQAENITYQYIDIIHDDALVDEYGWFIPVIKWQTEIFKSPLDLDDIIAKIRNK